MDLKNLNTRKACDQEVEIQLKHPANGEPLGTFITIVGSESSKLTEIDRRDTSSLATNLNLSSKDSVNKLIETAINGTVKWRDFKYNGKMLEFNQTNLEKMYKKEGFDWIPAQVHRAINDLSLFM